MKKILILIFVLVSFGLAFGADTYTSHYGLRLPDLNIDDEVTPWGQKFNTNFTLIDTAISAVATSTGASAVDIAALKVSTGVLQADLATEVSNRGIADTALGVTTGTIYAAVNSTGAALTLETAARVVADSALGITTGTIYAAVNSTGAALTLETAARVAADSALGITTGSIQAELTGVPHSTVTYLADGVSLSLVDATFSADPSSVTLQGPVVSSITLSAMYGAPTLTGTNFTAIPNAALITEVIPSSATGDYLLRVATATYLATAPGACTPGQYITGLTADGTKTCEAPAGGGDVVLASTQTFSGGNVFVGVSTFTGLTTISANYALWIDSEPTDGTGGGSAVTGAWRQRVLNTEVFDTGDLGVLTTSSVTMNAGTYFCEWGATFVQTGLSLTRLYNSTSGVVLGYGSTLRADPGISMSVFCTGMSRFTLSTTSNIVIQYRVGGAAANIGLGYPTYIAGVTSPEVYVRLQCTREK